MNELRGQSLPHRLAAKVERQLSEIVKKKEEKKTVKLKVSNFLVKAKDKARPGYNST